MIPDNELSTTPVFSQFLYPDNAITSLLEDFELGGIAIQDPSQGLNYQAWRGYWDPEDSTIYLQPLTVGGKIALFTVPLVKEFSFTFDQNMRWCVAVQLTSGTVNLYWYDTNAAAYVTTSYEGLRAFKLALDDKRRVSTYLDKSDILFTYIKGDSLYVRNQRERYTVEHFLKDEMPDNLRIASFGLNRGLRMQWRFMIRVFEEVA